MSDRKPNLLTAGESANYLHCDLEEFFTWRSQAYLPMAVCSNSTCFRWRRGDLKKFQAWKTRVALEPDIEVARQIELPEYSMPRARDVLTLAREINAAKQDPTPDDGWPLGTTSRRVRSTQELFDSVKEALFLAAHADDEQLERLGEAKLRKLFGSIPTPVLDELIDSDELVGELRNRFRELWRKYAPGMRTASSLEEFSKFRAELS